ncbi:MAG: hypothetical protein BWY86_01320 [Candidatus Aminicenantes bacterium ADurb.Bin508]|nr:MAG: hypothetical protein BWY86_01320 [Candidatus Aminicenantes bacterium ADurb.Bin508]
MRFVRKIVLPLLLLGALVLLSVLVFQKILPTEVQKNRSSLPVRVTVETILVAVEPGPWLPSGRPRSEALERLQKVLGRIAQGEDLGRIAKEMGDAWEPPFTLTAPGVSPAQGERRSVLVERGVVDCAFSLPVGMIRIIPYDPEGGSSPRGWIILKRVK